MAAGIVKILERIDQPTIGDPDVAREINGDTGIAGPTAPVHELEANGLKTSCLTSSNSSTIFRHADIKL